MKKKPSEGISKLLGMPSYVYYMERIECVEGDVLCDGSARFLSLRAALMTFRSDGRNIIISRVLIEDFDGEFEITGDEFNFLSKKMAWRQIALCNKRLR